MSLIYTELANDPMSGANAPTLNATNWELSTWPVGLGTAPIQILNHTAQATTNSNSCLELWHNAAWASDGQYVEVEIVTLEDNFNGEVDVYALSDINIEFNYLAAVNRVGSVATLDLYVTQGVVGGLLNGVKLAETTAVWHGSDVLRLEVYRGIQTVFWNAVPVIVTHDNSITTVSPFAAGLDIESFNDITLNSVINFKAGIITGTYTTYSVPDCRVDKPNTASAQIVNGTLTYNSQISSNTTVPSTDCRVNKPTACGTYPQNSRTPGTFGPGEN